MRRSYRLSIERAILLLVFVIMALMIWSNNMTINIFYPISALCLAGVLAGLFLPTIASTWVIIITFILGSFMVILGYVLIPVWERAIVVLTLPLVLALAALVKKRTESTVNAELDDKEILSYVRERDLKTTLWNEKEAQVFYNNCVNFLKKTKLSASQFSATLICWSHGEQYYQIDPDEADVVLNKIAKRLRKSRVPSERVFYMNDGYFLVLGSVNNQTVLNELNQQSVSSMEEVTFHNDERENMIQFQFSDEIVTSDNLDKFDKLDKMMKKLVREHEMKIVREYQ